VQYEKIMKAQQHMFLQRGITLEEKQKLLNDANFLLYGMDGDLLNSFK